MGIPIDEGDNADWTKTTWDLIGIDTVEKLRHFIENQGMTVDEFKQLPVYRWNVDKPEMKWLKEL